MKVVLLEHPRGRSARHFNTVVHTPLFSSLLSGYIASLLRAQGIETEIFDAADRDDDILSLAEEVSGFECDMLGVHLVYSWEHNPRVLDMVTTMGVNRGRPIIAYGFFPTFAFEYLLQACPAIDGVVRGEPEMTFVALCALAERGGDLRPVPGFACRGKDHATVYVPRKVVRDLDALPFPLRTETLLARSGGTVLGSRGCYGSCSFCSINGFYGGGSTWRGRSAGNIYAEVKTLLPVLERRYIYFLDANFFGPGEEGQVRAEQIAEVLEGEADLAFGLECRVNDVRERSLSRLVRAGLRDVFLGIESGSQRCLDRMNKRTTLEQNTRALSLLRDCGIEPRLGFIMFEGDATLEDLRSNLAFLKSHNLLGSLSTTVDLLYHPEFVLSGSKGITGWESATGLDPLSRGPAATSSKAKDARVMVCAHILFSVCQHLLALMDKPHSPLYWRHVQAGGQNPAAVGIADELNRWLVSLFEDLLSRLHAGPAGASSDWQQRFIGEACAYIDDMLAVFRLTPEGR